MNLAFFERYLWDGFDTYYSLIQEAKALGLEVIADAKRCDISSTARSYAEGLLANPSFVGMDDLAGPDAVPHLLECDGLQEALDGHRVHGEPVLPLRVTPLEVHPVVARRVRLRCSVREPGPR